MGLILDTSVLIASEKGKFDLVALLGEFGSEEIFIASITASELLHGVERAQPAARKKARSAYVESLLGGIETIDFDLGVARTHAALWATFEKAGKMIGPYDLLIAATALTYGYAIATLNTVEFKRVPQLKLVDLVRFTT